MSSVFLINHCSGRKGKGNKRRQRHFGADDSGTRQSKKRPGYSFKFSFQELINMNFPRRPEGEVEERESQSEAEKSDWDSDLSPIALFEKSEDSESESEDDEMDVVEPEQHEHAEPQSHAEVRGNEPPAAAEESQPTRKRHQYKCKSCGQLGHTKSTSKKCPNFSAAAAAQQ